MIQQITQLPAPPHPSDSPIEFDQKSFALLGGLPQFVDQANALGGQIFTIGEDATESAAAALASKNAAATSASNSAASASASSQSASNSASSANAANQSRIEAQSAAASAASVDPAYLRNRANHTGTQAIDTVSGLQTVLDAKASNLSVAQAIAMAATFTAVPATNKGPMVVVTQPHLRFMVWNGTKYVRAPWHAPGVLFFSHAPAASVTQGIQVRADVTYNTADHPDLAEMLGVVGPTFVLPEGRARVLRAADNGRGIDPGLVNGYLQEDAIRNLTGDFGAIGDFPGQAYPIGVGAASGVLRKSQGNGFTAGGSMVANQNTLPVLSGSVSFDASRQVPTATENRVKSLTATLYITR